MYNYQFLTALSPPRLSCRPFSISLLKACLQGDSKSSRNLSLIYDVGPYFPKGTSSSILSTSSLHFSSCAMYSAFNTALIAVYLGYGNISDETKCLQKFTLLLHKITLISLCQIICEVRTGLFTIQMQNQGGQEETIVEENSDLSTGRSHMAVGKLVNKICDLKERKLFLVTCKCRK